MNYNSEKLYTFLRGAASISKMEQTLISLPYSREKHKNQFRDSGEPYILHPLMVACHISSLSDKEDIKNLDILISSALLHDVCEDCNTNISELPVNNEVKNIVKLLTFNIKDGESKEIAKNRYYNDILENRNATIVKLVDRCNNVSTMAGPFTKERMNKYIFETYKYIYPLLESAMIKYPTDSNQLFIIKYHLSSLIDLAKRCVVKENDE